jgi:hypothetical protein
MVHVGGKDIEVTICDVANPCVFADAHDFNITGHESAADLTANEEWVASCQELRGKAAEVLGLTTDWRDWVKTQPFAPLPIFVAPPPDKSPGHVAGRLFLDKMCHESMAGTGAICTAACSRVPGTVVNRIVGQAAELETLEISHPIGSMSVFVQKEDNLSPGGMPVFRTMAFIRTARRIMDGTIYVPAENDGSKTSGIGRTVPNGASVGASDVPPHATTIIAEFVHNVRYQDLGDWVKVTLKNLILDYIGVTAAAAQKEESTEPVYNALLGLGAASGTPHGLYERTKVQRPICRALEWISRAFARL